MDNTVEIRWHGRGGQGAKTAALLFGEAAMSLGKNIQAFPEYGPERMGAPVASFNRISSQPINLHCSITNPSLVVVLDPTLMGKVDVTDGIPKGGAIIVNTMMKPAEIKKQLGVAELKVFTVDASGISKETIGREIPNTPMLGALAKVSGLLDYDMMIKDMEKKLSEKFKNKPEIVKGNLEAIKRAYNEVHGE
ncbi:pyruvate synthase [candidate division WOR-1 bacterium RIFOXYA12_FULL_52_29]|uniref:Pyruvate synthase n=1 Tax=candidate division WOR-1 bacterium RIFOXYC12_FULL_54_18 TaxID=1802584 RepID=A0A1F4T7R4_UNCSA|nr:MAG: pyruvate synthase [candidate division WOR-1 bacterium RIFOXYA2_FULL_51_19]OGC18338.1 MAG: pyruvate synthase [candidate division WOR-1 bacterium RIFOXYA12_FULL_52_29]OGC27193.1 MAG: pyruvate synthase [candidate division WOR-1 bacterium RIFOXYB2_FULL_45_9]OGC28755.1 MAG: pyruvate synthase [candidate division WOR-1 bacterium RIFOXYC12_FULL_54_18]OGC30790.1 MAG: pyruvate synthase [candidate division WOR-1 bacterium RIFOXYB12_FULL_52_16]